MSAMENSEQLWEVGAAPEAVSVPMADWWRRLAALVVDVATMWIPLGFLTRSMNMGRYTGFLASVAVGVTYFALLNGGRRGQTLLFLIPILGFVLWLADGFSPLWDRRRQAVHDKLAGSVVVSAR